MSQVDLNGEPLSRPDHLTDRFPGDNAKGNAHSLNPDKEREWYCRECHNRVTQATDRQYEYGHAKGCSHSIGRDSR
jgi:uncharacterized protein YlaI